MSTNEMQKATPEPLSAGEIIRRLKEPFDFNEIEWKIQVTTADKARGMAVAYVNSRAIQKRLDEAVGAFNWRNEYKAWQEKAQVCGLSIYHVERGDWVTKCDGAENTDIEPVKGGLSDAFKRTASIWGIGRYLYELESVWVEIEPKGKSFAIKQDQYGKLETAYNKTVAQIFGAAAIKNTGVSQPKTEAPKQSQPARQSSSQQAQQAPQQSQTAQQAPQQNQTAQQSSPSVNPDIEPIYTVQSVKQSGRGSLLLELTGGNGQIVKAYARSDNNDIREGTRLRNVSIIQKNGNYGLYNQINAYDVAA